MPDLTKPTTPHPVLPWHLKTAEDFYPIPPADNPWGDIHAEKRAHLSTIIARHDPHAETLRLLERAHEWLDDYGMRMSGCAGLSDEIRAHLAALKGTQ